jgi:predicted DNA-binding transcriptional regulator AlpA
MVSRTTLHKLRQVDGFPPPVVRVGKVQRWRQDDVLGWIEEQAKKGTPEAA